MEIVIQRFDPEHDSKPYLQSYTVDPSAFQGVMLLDALEHLKTQDPTLSFRRSCGGGVCGSDGMSINGRNGLACVTQLNTLPQKVTLYPLPGMPVIRDLIVDLTRFYKQYESIKPWLVGDEVSPDSERLQSQVERSKLDGLYECILCACCTTSCPSFWWNPDDFAGPAALLSACRFIQDSRDHSKAERLKALEGLYALYRCRSIMNCTSVCPKSLNPAEAIATIRRDMLNAGTSNTELSVHS
ncbi:MAG: succinate dehydrogenase iron-sulfur subunit [Legionellales bacterium]|nr:succinate dehydrogenase iron-sulfur subunit [Legionellales bacterium]